MGTSRDLKNLVSRTVSRAFAKFTSTTASPGPPRAQPGPVQKQQDRPQRRQLDPGAGSAGTTGWHPAAGGVLRVSRCTGRTAEGHLGSSVGSGASSRYPRLTANRKNPFSARYLKCQSLVTGPVPARNTATASARIG